MSVNLVSKSAYARHRGVDEKAVRRAVSEGRISLINGKIDPAVADIQWAANTRARVGTGSGLASAVQTTDLIAGNGNGAYGVPPTPTAASPALSSGYTDARARRELADAETSEIQLRKLRGEMLVTVDVARAGFEIGREMRDAMEASVNSLASELAAVSSADACADSLRRHNRALQDLLVKLFREKIGAVVANAV